MDSLVKGISNYMEINERLNNFKSYKTDKPTLSPLDIVNFKLDDPDESLKAINNKLNNNTTKTHIIEALTWNINTDSNAFNEIVKYLASYPDAIVCLQEVLKTDVEKYANHVYKANQSFTLEKRTTVDIDRDGYSLKKIVDSNKKKVERDEKDPTKTVEYPSQWMKETQNYGTAILWGSNYVKGFDYDPNIHESYTNVQYVNFRDSDPTNYTDYKDQKSITTDNYDDYADKAWSVRSTEYIVLEHKTLNKKIGVISVHLQQNRTKSVSLMKHILTSINAKNTDNNPVIVMGDFNFRVRDDTDPNDDNIVNLLRHVKGYGFNIVVGTKNVVTTTKENLDIAFLRNNNVTNWDFSKDPPFLERLDYVFHKNLICLDEEIAKYNKYPLDNSKIGNDNVFDHAPIYFTFSLDDILALYNTKCSNYDIASLSDPLVDYGRITTIKFYKQIIKFTDYEKNTYLFQTFKTAFGEENMRRYDKASNGNLVIILDTTLNQTKCTLQSNGGTQCTLGPYTFFYNAPK